MPVFDSKKAETPIFEVINGDYPFEIVAVDNSISQGQKTRGCDVREVKFKFYKDATFTQPIAQWTEDFINFDTCHYKWIQLAIAVGLVVAEGQEFDIDSSWIGRRGWATCKPQETNRKDDIDPATGKLKRYNRVAVFITNKGHLPRNAGAPALASKVDDDLPF